MSRNPEQLKFAPTHEWAQLEEGPTVRVGISDFAQSELGDIMFVNLPAVGAKVAAGQPIASIESVKTASDLHSPINGQVSAINPDIQSQPELINEAPYAAWLFSIQADDPADLDALLDYAAYRQLHQL